MTVSAKTVYDIAISLMDELAVNGMTDSAENADFLARALPLLAVLGSECSLLCLPQPRKEFIPPQSMTDEIALPATLCISALPYGLAALLTLESAPETGEKLLQRYKEQLELYRRSFEAKLESIEDVYS